MLTAHPTEVWEPMSTNIPSIGEINDQNAPGMRLLPGGDDDGREQQILLGAAAHTPTRICGGQSLGHGSLEQSQRRSPGRPRLFSRPFKVVELLDTI